MDMFDLGETFGGIETALKRVVCPVMVMGVQTDILFPIEQQREMSKLLKKAGGFANFILLYFWQYCIHKFKE